MSPKNYAIPVLILCFVAGCDQVKDDHSYPSTYVDTVAEALAIEKGSGPEPELTVNFPVRGISGRFANPVPTPSLYLLDRGLLRRPGVRYAAFASVLHENSEYAYYSYRQIQLRFPERLTRLAREKTRWYAYQLRTRDGKVLRRLEALIPDDPWARRLMDAWVSGQHASKRSSDGRDVPASGYEEDASDPAFTGDDCYQFDEGEQCDYTWDPSYGWMLCEVEVCGGSDSGTADDTWSSDWPYDYDNDPYREGFDTFGDEEYGGGFEEDAPGDDTEADCDIAQITCIPTNPPPGVDDSIYMSLNSAERRLCWHNPMECITVYRAKTTAVEWSQAEERFGTHNGRQDAVRHAMWSAIMAFELDAERAARWGDAHEESSGDPAETAMDQHNNAVGRSIGTEVQSENGDFPDLERGVRSARDSGALCLSTSCTL